MNKKKRRRTGDKKKALMKGLKVGEAFASPILLV